MDGMGPDGSPRPTMEALFAEAPAAHILYNLEVLHAILIPTIDPLNDDDGW